MCLDGKFEIEYYDAEKIIVEKGETVLIPAVIEHLVLKPVVQSKLLEVYIPEQTNESKSKK
jgi:mannose-6-phosphate isomerase